MRPHALPRRSRLGPLRHRRRGLFAVRRRSSGQVVRRSSLPPATPRIFSDLNALFLIAVGIGYALPWRDPARYRAYMWIMGPLLKGAGAAAFLLDYAFRGSPPSFLLFAASDGLLALVTLLVLVEDRGGRRR